MKIDNRLYMTYEKYEDFVSDFLRDTMSYGAVSLIVNWSDALGVCQLLNTYTINGNSIAMRYEYTDKAYSDVVDQKEVNGNILITLLANGEIICEKAIDDICAYTDGLYYIEASAEDVVVPLHAKVIPFKIENSVFDDAF